MQTGNTLRAARNSLLCFFMALVAGFLVACGGGGSPATSSPQEFRAFLFDTAVEGVEYSGPTGNGLTGKGGVFSASEGVFEFSIGDITLGSVQMSRNQDEDNEVTPADFIGVDEAQVITIARIMQGLDNDSRLQNGISISQNTRENASSDALRSRLALSTLEVLVVVGTGSYTLPPEDDAKKHLAATRMCLFSGGYVGDYRATLHSGGEELDEGRVYYAVEPFANRARRFGFTGDVDELRSFQTSTVGVIGSVITLTLGNELSFATPFLVTGVWQNTDGDNTVSGTHRLELVAGHPGASRRIVGVETTDDTETAAGLYVLDHFIEDGDFLGRYYDLGTDGVSVLALSLAIDTTNGVSSWPANNGMSMLTLIGTRGEDATTITMEIVRMDENYGTFEEVGNNALSGTWCDIGGAVGSTNLPTAAPRTPPAPRASAQSDTEIEVTWSAVPRATVYKLYRSESSGVSGSQVGGDISALRYLDIGLTAEIEYFYQLEACNSGGCSRRSPEVSVTTQSAAPVAPSGGGGGGGGGNGGGVSLADPCFLGQPLEPGDSCSFIEHTISVSSVSGGLSKISLDPPPATGPESYTRDPRGLDVTYTLTNRSTNTILGIIIIRNLGDDNTWRIRTLTTF